MKHPYQDPRVTEETRVQDLLARMSLEEKFSQLRMEGDICRLFQDKTLSEENFDERFAKVYDSSRTSCCYLSFDADPALVNRMQRYVIEHSRLGIPMLVMGESTAAFTVSLPSAIT